MANILKARTLNALRRVARTKFLPETCSIYAPPTAGDGQGGESGAYPAGWQSVATVVACRLEPPGQRQSSEKLRAGSAQSVVSFTIALPYAQAIKPSYRIRITSLGNRDFEVLGVQAGSYEVERLVDCSEVQK